MSENSPEYPQPEEQKISRRDAIKSIANKGAHVAAFSASLMLLKTVLEQPGQSEVMKDTDSLSQGNPLSTESFVPFEQQQEMSHANELTAEDIQQQIEVAIRESIQNGERCVVTLPEGEIILEKPITCAIPDMARILLQGHENGSRLTLHSELSDVSKEWGSFAERSLLYFDQVEGEVILEDIQFDGCSERAGESGYLPPLSPWDAMVLIVGKGEGEPTNGYRHGEQYDPAMENAGKRTGKAVIRNCTFENSESGGMMLQNLGVVEAENSQGRKLDSLLNASWCDDVTAKNLSGERFASDGMYITSAQRVLLDDCSIHTARQGYDLQGVKDAVLHNCNAYDCAKAYELTLSETDKTTLSDAVTLIDCDTEDCMQVYSIGPVNRVTVDGGKHDRVGSWYKQYYEGEFLHNSGIRRPEDIAGYPSPIVDYALQDAEGNKVTGEKKLDFKDVQIRISREAPDNFVVPELPGVTYTRE